jgi:hypothetical protein
VTSIMEHNIGTRTVQEETSESIRARYDKFASDETYSHAMRAFWTLLLHFQMFPPVLIVLAFVSCTSRSDFVCLYDINRISIIVLWCLKTPVIS